MNNFPRLVALTLAPLLAAAALIGIPAAASAATDDVTWTVRTASNSLGAERTNFSYTLNPGAHLDDGIVIANRGTETVELDVYAADGYTTSTGALDLRLVGDSPVGVGKWISVPQGHVSVPAGQTAEVPFAIDIPADATPGDYAGGVVTSLTVADQTANVNVDRRLGIRTGIRVGGDLAPALTLDGVRVDWDGGLVPFLFGDATVHYSLHNAGNVSLSADDTDAVAGPFGWGEVDATPGEAAPVLLPGESWQRDVRVPAVAAMGLVWASVTAIPTVTDASGSTTDLDPVTASAMGWAVPWPILVVLLLIVAAVILGPRWLRARRRRRQEAEDARVAEAVARTLAEKEDVATPAG
ncbi:WxL protein peptidoglycan domain-containing protein [Microbacterium sp. 1P10AE]|uniref:WxL protein peptidoglycan domain-containing protein n=1 Tax=Microbacterium sp. 1P10AE TaxID=3132286 RepID=UPI00399F3431